VPPLLNGNYISYFLKKTSIIFCPGIWPYSDEWYCYAGAVRWRHDTEPVLNLLISATVLLVLLTCCLYMQMMRFIFYHWLRNWNITSRTSSSQTTVCWRSCWGWTCWVGESALMFAVRERCIEETTPYWICSSQRSSASSSSKPYNERDNSTWQTMSHKMEVRCSKRLLNVAHGNEQTVVCHRLGACACFAV